MSRKNSKTRAVWNGVPAGPRHRRDRDYGLSKSTQPRDVSVLFGARSGGTAKP